MEWYIQYTEQVDNYFYDTEGINSIFYSNDNETYILEQDNGYTTSYELMVGTDSEKNISYGFDDNYELRSKMMFSDATDLEELPLSSNDKTIIKYGLEKTSKQLLKQLPSPIINLQWIFDWTYTGHRTPKIWLSALILSSGCMTIIFTLKKLIRKYDTKN